MGVRVTLNKAAVRARVHTASEEATFAVANELLKDANYYCREDTGMLIASSLKASQPDKGLLIWDTPYAKRMYYTGSPSHDVNPNASTMWVHKAKSKHREKYKRIAQKFIKQGV
jgi:hypothetical protein